jgi:hypothetical protein
VDFLASRFAHRDTSRHRPHTDRAVGRT